jgi:hypothetical protein
VAFSGPTRSRRDRGERVKLIAAAKPGRRPAACRRCFRLRLGEDPARRRRRR